MHDIRNPKFEAELLELVPALKKFARSFYASQADIDDLVQETILKALGNSEKFQDGTRLKSWLFTIMRNSFCTRFGIARREHVGFDEVMEQRPTVQPHQEWSVRGHELEHAIARLPDQYRTAINLIFIQGTSYETAASQCGCPVGTMKSRVNRAREKLTRELDA